MYKCKYCGQLVFSEDEDYSFYEFGEEMLWGHIQMCHEDVFDEVRDWETPFMLEECYEEV